MSTANTESQGAYRIGAVARLTGISPDTLRIWERRYDVMVTDKRLLSGIFRLKGNYAPGVAPSDKTFDGVSEWQAAGLPVARP